MNSLFLISFWSGLTWTFYTPVNNIVAIFCLLYITCWKVMPPPPPACLWMEQSQASDKRTGMNHRGEVGGGWGGVGVFTHQAQRVCVHVCICVLPCKAWWGGTRLPMLSHELILKHTSPRILTSSRSLSFFLSVAQSHTLLPLSPFPLSATYWSTTQHSFAFSLPLLSFSPRHFSPVSCLNCNSLHLTFQLPYTNKRTEHFGRA